MSYTTRRVTAAAGVGLAALVAALVVMPATIRLGEVAGLWSASMVLGAPVAVILAATGTPLHGAWRATMFGVVVAALTCAVTITAALQIAANVIGGTTSGLVLAAALYGSPTVSVLLFGGCAMLFAPQRPTRAPAAAPAIESPQSQAPAVRLAA